MACRPPTPATEEARLQDAVHGVLVLVVDLDWRGRQLALVGERVVGGMFQ